MADKPQVPTLRVGMISLGCAKNLVDSELMLGALLREGVELTNDPAAAHALIINTCSFIDSAQEESVDSILESAEVRDAHNRGQALVVAGCLPQRFRHELPKLLPEVDAFMGIDQVPRVRAIIMEALDRRKSKLQTGPGAAVEDSRRANGRSKRQLLKSIEELERAKPSKADPVEESQSLRGTSRFGNTKVVIAVPPAISRAPLFDVSQRPKYIPDYATPRFRLTPRHFAYLKIAEGCNHPCSFCIIPSMRGSHRSRTQADVVAEARALVEDGVKEINLISQDSTYYGLDLRPNHSRAISSPQKFGAALASLPPSATTICSLLRELNALPGDFWIRLLYTHPAHWSDELIQTIADCPKVARYVDMPLQHIHENMLERMRRETSRAHIETLLSKLRAAIPGITLRTTFIVGFPGETEEYFQALLEFIERARFERLGVFAFSREEGTRAGAMAGQIPDGVKRKRKEAAMKLQRKISREICRGAVGTKLRVLVEREATAAERAATHISSWEHGQNRVQTRAPQLLTKHGHWLVARGHGDAPDIDGRVYVQGRLTPGEFAQVQVIGSGDYDLVAKPVD